MITPREDSERDSQDPERLPADAAGGDSSEVAEEKQSASDRGAWTVKFQMGLMNEVIATQVWSTAKKDRKAVWDEIAHKLNSAFKISWVNGKKVLEQCTTLRVAALENHLEKMQARGGQDEVKIRNQRAQELAAKWVEAKGKSAAAKETTIMNKTQGAKVRAAASVRQRECSTAQQELFRSSGSGNVAGGVRQRDLTPSSVDTVPRSLTSIQILLPAWKNLQQRGESRETALFLLRISDADAKYLDDLHLLSTPLGL